MANMYINVRHLTVSMPVIRKFSPPRYTDPVRPLSLLVLNKYPNSLQLDGSCWSSPSPPPGMRPKVKGQRGARPPLALDPRDGEREAGDEAKGAAHRARKKGYKPPDVRTIFEARVQDPRVRVERGEGHAFILKKFCLDWCDVCCKNILQDCLECTGCKYTCHPHCRDQVTLDCHSNVSPNDGPLSPLNQDHLNNNQSSHNFS
ncbi:ras association domain-containing protein 5-like [Hoplias malabaricus]|uniref:ras association domain-containing protein 5-like n=1 Tax=Hoplias malabaricus TaxID=27720 RepID=UPI0034633F83